MRAPVEAATKVQLLALFQALGVATPNADVVALASAEAIAVARQAADRGRRSRPWASNLHVSTRAHGA